MKATAYQQITEQLVGMLESVTVDSELPWRRVASTGTPRNAVSHRPYNGINHAVLGLTQFAVGYSSPYWVTYKQAQQLGGNVRKGEKGTKVLFFKMLEKERADGTTDNIPMAKGYTVFNVDQCEGIEIVGSTREETTTSSGEIFDWAMQIARIEFGGNRAFYSPSEHYIQMPHRTQFHNDEGFHATLLHELTHWTKRDLERDTKGDYAFEELVAELGATFLCEHFGVRYALEGHASYLKSWLGALKGDPKYLYKAAKLAEQAAQHLIGLGNDEQQEAA